MNHYPERIPSPESISLPSPEQEAVESFKNNLLIETRHEDLIGIPIKFHYRRETEHKVTDIVIHKSGSIAIDKTKSEGGRGADTYIIINGKLTKIEAHSASFTQPRECTDEEVADFIETLSARAPDDERVDIEFTIRTPKPRKKPEKKD